MADPTRRLLVASNRGPLKYTRAPDGSLGTTRASGGLVTALGGLATNHEGTWVASAQSDEDRQVAERGSFAELDAAGNAFRLRLLDHPPSDYEHFYARFATPLLAVIQHQLWPPARRPSIDRATYSAWDAYRAVNRTFAEALAEE